MGVYWISSVMCEAKPFVRVRQEQGCRWHDWRGEGVKGNLQSGKMKILKACQYVKSHRVRHDWSDLAAAAAAFWIPCYQPMIVTNAHKHTHTHMPLPSQLLIKIYFKHILCIKDIDISSLSCYYTFYSLLFVYWFCYGFYFFKFFTMSDLTLLCDFSHYF